MHIIRFWKYISAQLIRFRWPNIKRESSKVCIFNGTFWCYRACDHWRNCWMITLSLYLWVRFFRLNRWRQDRIHHQLSWIPISSQTACESNVCVCVFATIFVSSFGQFCRWLRASYQNPGQAKQCTSDIYLSAMSLTSLCLLMSYLLG